jgi:hypothetical protein
VCQQNVKFCCTVKYVNIHIFSLFFTFNLAVTKKNCGRWRKTAYVFEFSVKSSIRIRYFSSWDKQKKLNFVDRCYQCNETNVMHFASSLLRIKARYMFRALLAHLREVLHKWHFVCSGRMSVGCGTFELQLTLHSHNTPYIS